MKRGNLPPRGSADLEAGILPASNTTDQKVSVTSIGTIMLVEGKRPQVEGFDGKSRYICRRENASISVSKALT